MLVRRRTLSRSNGAASRHRALPVALPRRSIVASDASEEVLRFAICHCCIGTDLKRARAALG